MKIKLVNFEYMGRIKEWNVEAKEIIYLDKGFKVLIENPTPFEPQGELWFYFDDKNHFDRKNTDIEFAYRMNIEII